MLDLRYNISGLIFGSIIGNSIYLYNRSLYPIEPIDTIYNDDFYVKLYTVSVVSGFLGFLYPITAPICICTYIVSLYINKPKPKPKPKLIYGTSLL